MSQEEKAGSYSIFGQGGEVLTSSVVIVEHWKEHSVELRKSVNMASYYQTVLEISGGLESITTVKVTMVASGLQGFKGK